jgi:hypothetical protein
VLHHGFNADFYMTAAAIIPLLYIALSLQGTTYSQIIAHWLSARKEYEKAIRTALEIGTSAPFLWIAFKSAGLNFVASVIWYSGIIGEALAVWALYEQSANSFIDWFVLMSIFALLSVAAITTWWPYYKVRKQTLRLGSLFRKDYDVSQRHEADQD